MWTRGRLSSYRVGNSPTNTLTPLDAYFALVVGFAQKYVKDTEIGAMVALLLPYATSMAIAWTGIFTIWYLLRLPRAFTQPP